MQRTPTMLLACLLPWLLCSCVPPAPDTGDDDSQAGDDDDAVDDDDDAVDDDDDVVGDDDDDAVDDDDDAVDDDDDAVGDDDDAMPSEPGGCSFEVFFDASGGAGPGTADVDLTWHMLDDASQQNILCSYQFGFDASFPSVSPNLGPDYHTFIDLAVTFDSLTSSYDDCPASYDEYVGNGDPVGALQWLISPLAVISCDLIQTVPNLSGEQFVDDIYAVGMSDGTLGSWCDEFGPIAETAYGFGPMEGVWVKPADSAYGAGTYNVHYFEAANGDVGGLGYYDSWAVMGTVFADSSNSYEPGEGIEGGYATVPLWIFSYN
jgi:hypothetical protein